jgi:hypothetical protein
LSSHKCKISGKFLLHNKVYQGNLILIIFAL